ncbi:radical SAM protein [Thermosyntropha sp.]|uniref:elongator complex protein 3 n=1 Tax=Thermosyntropha sp. TaxID=2740820 RepID=UPI0025FADFBD|nr:radical SAM protein [Thermosyntropha sp.]MBO8159438.1 radical SAM protein [Thermosyntropha sp.]
MRRHVNIPVFVPHLGCPFNCIFCNQKKIAAPNGVVSPEEVSRIIDEHLATVSDDAVVEVAFFGGSFTAIEQELQEAYLARVAPYIEKGRVKSIRISTRPDFINHEILSFLKFWHVETIELGVQSLYDEVLKASCRGYRVCDVFKACHLIKEYGFKLGIQLMIGLPEDTYERSQGSACIAAQLKPDMVRIYPTLVISGTRLEKMLISGEYQPLALEKAVAISADMFLIFNYYDIEVIRMGLQPSEELRSEGVVRAGPFHPAFGELVEQEVFRRQGEKLLSEGLNLSYKGEVVFLVNPRDVSKMVGYKRENIDFYRKELGIKVKVKPCPLIDPDDIGMSFDGERIDKILSRTSFLQDVQRICHS